MENINYTFVVVGIKGDLEKLERDYEIIGVNAVDLKELEADRYDMRDLMNAGLKKLCNVVLGKELEKPSERTFVQLFIVPTHKPVRSIFVSIKNVLTTEASKIVGSTVPS
ncbi:hypothetical protein RND71_029775 [Anisodus tanguticus]|uniref:Uncharacterized protein n=1 Tax=Anisodus tanguticus TaxID=243964 RepID=A0AAE1RGZ0_9SOLA|nr:hypothetical protein RND71_029775 [Anisodus tanguticus]